MKTKKFQIKNNQYKKSKKFRKYKNSKQYGGNDECIIKVNRYDYKEQVNNNTDKECNIFYYEDNNNFYKLRNRSRYNIFGKTRCTPNPPSGSLRKLCKNNLTLRSDKKRSEIFQRSQKRGYQLSKKRSQQQPPMPPIDEEKKINLGRTSSYRSPLTEKMEKTMDKINIDRIIKTSNRPQKSSIKYSIVSNTINDDY